MQCIKSSLALQNHHKYCVVDYGGRACALLPWLTVALNRWKSAGAQRRCIVSLISLGAPWLILTREICIAQK